MTEHLTEQQRNDFIERSRNKALETLEIQEVQRRLGGYTNELFALARSVVATTPEQTHAVDPRAIPTVVLRTGERAVRLVTAEPFDAFQLETMHHKYGDAKTQVITDHYRGAFKNKTRPFQVADELAHVHTLDVLDGEDRIIKGRPTLSLNYDKSNGLYVHPVVLNHELYHARHNRLLPVWENSEIDFDGQDLSEELEGYRLSAMTILGIQDAGLQHELFASIPHESIDRALEIEDIRAHANNLETNPYAASQKVATELIKHGHGITPFLRAKL